MANVAVQNQGDRDVQLYRLADAFENIASLTPYIVTTLLNKIVETKRFDEEFIAGMFAEIILKHPIPPPIASILYTTISHFVHSSADVFLNHNQQNFSLDRIDSCYFIFFRGKFQFYGNGIPNEITYLKNKTIFWIDKVKNEYLTLGKTVPKGNHLSSKQRDMLLYFCSDPLSGKRVRLADVYNHVWKNSGFVGDRKMQNSIAVAINKINNYADSKFIAEDREAYIQRIRGSDKFIVKPQCVDALCLFDIRRQEKNSFEVSYNLKKYSIS